MTTEMNVNQDNIIVEIKQLVAKTRDKVAKQINNEAIVMSWNIGKMIVEFEQQNHFTDKTAKSFILELSKVLSRDIGKGYSRSNLFNMRKFYMLYPSVQTLSGQLSWSHYCELIYVSDNAARDFYEKETIKSNWNVRILHRQINTSLFERILLSDGSINKQKVLELANDGLSYAKPSDILKEPFVFEFLGIAENKPILEKELEKALIEKIEDFLLELGRGFMFVGSQQRLYIGNTNHYVDLVFYNKILKAYVLIDLKINKFVAENIGQMNMYVNYYAAEVNDAEDNPPIGIVLCADNSEIVAEYALGGLENQIFASKYTYYIPDKEQLIRQVEAVIRDMENSGENK